MVSLSIKQVQTSSPATATAVEGVNFQCTSGSFRTGISGTGYLIIRKKNGRRAFTSCIIYVRISIDPVYGYLVWARLCTVSDNYANIIYINISTTKCFLYSSKPFFISFRTPRLLHYYYCMCIFMCVMLVEDIQHVPPTQSRV